MTPATASETPVPTTDALDLITQVAAARTVDAYWVALDRLLRNTVGYDTLLGTYRTRSYLIGPQGQEHDGGRLAAVYRLQHPYLSWEGKAGIVLVDQRLLDLRTLHGLPPELQDHGWTHALILDPAVARS